MKYFSKKFTLHFLGTKVLDKQLLKSRFKALKNKENFSKKFTLHFQGTKVLDNQLKKV